MRKCPAAAACAPPARPIEATTRPSRRMASGSVSSSSKTVTVSGSCGIAAQADAGSAGPGKTYVRMSASHNRFQPVEQSHAGPQRSVRFDERVAGQQQEVDLVFQAGVDDSP